MAWNVSAEYLIFLFKKVVKSLDSLDPREKQNGLRTSLNSTMFLTTNQLTYLKPCLKVPQRELTNILTMYVRWIKSSKISDNLIMWHLRHYWRWEYNGRKTQFSSNMLFFLCRLGENLLTMLWSKWSPLEKLAYVVPSVRTIAPAVVSLQWVYIYFIIVKFEESYGTHLYFDEIFVFQFQLITVPWFTKTLAWKVCMYCAGKMNGLPVLIRFEIGFLR